MYPVIPILIFFGLIAAAVIYVACEKSRHV